MPRNYYVFTALSYYASVNLSLPLSPVSSSLSPVSPPLSPRFSSSLPRLSPSLPVSSPLRPSLFPSLPPSPFLSLSPSPRGGVRSQASRTLLLSRLKESMRQKRRIGLTLKSLRWKKDSPWKSDTQLLANVYGVMVPLSQSKIESGLSISAHLPETEQSENM